MAVDTDVTFEAYREEWLSDVREGDPSNVDLDNRFAYKLMTQWREYDASSGDLELCDGSKDGGIDLAFLDVGENTDIDDGERAGDTWYLVQSKYGKAFRGSTTLLSESQKVINTLTGNHSKLSSLAGDVIERIKTFRSMASDQDRIVLVFATVEPLTDAQKQTLKDVRSVGRDRLGSIFEVESVSVETIFQRIREGLDTSPRVSASLKAALSPSGEDLLVGAVPLLELYRFLKEYRDQTEDLDWLYEKNVRRFLGKSNKVNKAIQKTLQETPELFGLYNNGITVVVNDLVHGDGGVELIEPYVVNAAKPPRRSGRSSTESWIREAPAQ